MTALAVLSAEQIIHDQAKTHGMVYEQASRHQVLQKRIAGLARFAFRSGTIDDGIEFFDRQIVLAAPPRRDLDPLLPRLCTPNPRPPNYETPNPKPQTRNSLVGGGEAGLDLVDAGFQLDEVLPDLHVALDVRSQQPHGDAQYKRRGP